MASKTTTSTSFNLLVTFNPSQLQAAQQELDAALRRIGEEPIISPVDVEGIFRVSVSDARKVIARLRTLCQADPNLFSVTYRYTPIDVWCASTVRSITAAAKKLARNIDSSEKWKLIVNKRHWEKADSQQLIAQLAQVISLPNVNLENPQKILKVEIISKEAGLSLLTPDDFFNVLTVKAQT